MPFLKEEKIHRNKLSNDDACVGLADGWGEHACAAALTVGLIFCTLFHQGKSVREFHLLIC
jgi:hypothetical protein